MTNEEVDLAKKKINFYFLLIKLSSSRSELELSESNENEIIKHFSDKIEEVVPEIEYLQENTSEETIKKKLEFAYLKIDQVVLFKKQQLFFLKEIRREYDKLISYCDDSNNQKEKKEKANFFKEVYFPTLKFHKKLREFIYSKENSLENLFIKNKQLDFFSFLKKESWWNEEFQASYFEALFLATDTSLDSAKRLLSKEWLRLSVPLEKNNYEQKSFLAWFSLKCSFIQKISFNKNRSTVWNDDALKRINFFLLMLKQVESDWKKKLEVQSLEEKKLSKKHTTISLNPNNNSSKNNSLIKTVIVILTILGFLFIIGGLYYLYYHRRWKNKSHKTTKT